MLPKSGKKTQNEKFHAVIAFSDVNSLLHNQISHVPAMSTFHSAWEELENGLLAYEKSVLQVFEKHRSFCLFVFFLSSFYYGKLKRIVVIWVQEFLFWKVWKL